MLFMKFQYFLILLFLVACKATKPAVDTINRSNDKPDVMQSAENSEKANKPNLLLYKTKFDCSNLVPVVMSADKKEIVSYPDPKDLLINGTLQKPIALHGGYWLDRRGINRNVVFLNISYEEYVQQKGTLPVSDMLNKIVDKDPLIELYDCGRNVLNQELITSINRWIDEQELGQHCKRLK
jgi:hypothetical protein